MSDVILCLEKKEINRYISMCVQHYVSDCKI